MIAKSKRYDYDRDNDGEVMIAISSKGRTLLGRMLAAGAFLPTTHPDYGSFNSMAGFIRYLSGDRRELMREISGIEYDDALTQKVPPHYEDVIQEHLINVLTTGRAAQIGLIKLLQDNTLPCSIYHDAGEELVNQITPEWFDEVLHRLQNRKLTS